ncbi:glycosyltransferase family 4 protein [Roseiflexus sp.]
MKIVLPVHHFLPKHVGGAELYTLRLSNLFRARGHSVEIVCVESLDGDPAIQVEAERDFYHDVPVWRLRLPRDCVSEGLGMLYDYAPLGAWFADYVQREHPDVVHFQAGYLIGVAPLRAAVSAGIPTVLTLHDHWFLCPRIMLQRGDGSICTAIPDDPAGCAWCMLLEKRRYHIADHLTGGLAGRLAQLLMLIPQREAIAERRSTLMESLSLPDIVIAPSMYLARRFAEYFQAGRMIVLRGGIDLAPFQKVLSAQHDGILRFGFIGLVAPHKGVHLLIEAFRLLNNRERPVELHIYGNTDAYPAYVRELRQKARGDDRIHFHGRFEPSRVAEVFAGFDVTVLPSLCYENNPLVILESYAAGKPVITAAMAGMKELVNHAENGLHFKAADARDLARQMQLLIDDTDLLPKLRRGIRPPRSIDQEAEDLLGIYERLCQQRNSPSSKVV